MKCPYCGCDTSKVIDSRPTEDNEKIRRRRECVACKNRFTTYEEVETLPVIVIKKDKSRQAFDRNKVIRSMIKACEKRAVPLETIDAAATEIETTLANSLDREVSSVRIGELVMEKLKQIDQVAYVRFASVYRQFSDIQSFMDELKGLMREQGHS